MAEKRGYNRREFLTVLGATGGLAAAGCSKELPEKLIPYVIQPDEIIPGVAAWYAGTCAECGAGCGILVRTREGRAVKVEGNSRHPINKGGLCVLGQSALQSLYDPDRVREPLQRKINSGPFLPVSWPDGIKALSDAITNRAAGKEFVLVTPPVSGSVKSLIGELSGQIKGLRHVEYELSDSALAEEACAACFGEGLFPRYDISKAEVLVNFGAGFLENWISPVEFARQWADARRSRAAGGPGEPKPGAYFVHFEPRLSRTAANADRYVNVAPNSEVWVLLALTNEVVARTGAKRLSPELVQALSAVAPGVDLNAALELAGVDRKFIEALADRLLRAESSLVLAGGSALAGGRGYEACVLGFVLNAVLGNIGSSLTLEKRAARPAPYAAMLGLIKDLKEKKVGVLMLSGVNPVYTLPRAAGFAEALTQADFVAACAVNVDETASLAQLVLPLSTVFESWGDSEPRPELYNLQQPAMQPLYQTQSLGDNLISLAAALSLNVENGASFLEYMRRLWRKRTGEDRFEERWRTFLEQGGDYSAPAPHQAAALKAAALDFRIPDPARAEGELTFLAFTSNNSPDGRASNRPWIQELPDPMTTAVWGSWLEIHPDTAARHGLSNGDVAQVLAASHEGLSGRAGIELPVFVTPHIHPGLIAAPTGQGHQAMGRYAVGVGANSLRLLPAEPLHGAMQFASTAIGLRKGFVGDELIVLQGHDSQEKRGILRTVKLSELEVEGGKESMHGASAAAEGAHKEQHVGYGQVRGKHRLVALPVFPPADERDPQALGPQEPPKQMFEQMEHPVYRWGMTIDLNSCTGCSACVVACYAENNVAVVGKEMCGQGRDMAWLHIERYLDGNPEQPVTGFMPMLCQHCGNAPCEPVCPVYATYHNEEGLNSMVYNRCVGTRYCSNNCSYKVRRFNWFHIVRPEPLNWQLNPDVTVREVGVMEKCTFCVQRIREAENAAKNLGREVKDGDVQPACASSCPTKAIKFGNLRDAGAEVSKDLQSPRSYRVLDQYINTQPAITYLARVKAEENR